MPRRCSLNTIQCVLCFFPHSSSESPVACCPMICGLASSLSVTLLCFSSLITSHERQIRQLITEMIHKKKKQLSRAQCVERNITKIFSRIYQSSKQAAQPTESEQNNIFFSSATAERARKRVQNFLLRLAHHHIIIEPEFEARLLPKKERARGEKTGEEKYVCDAS